MSASLNWAPSKRSGERLDTALKWIIEKRWSVSSTPLELGDGDLSYLYGLRDAGISDADKLIAGIEKFGRVEIWLEY